MRYVICVRNPVDVARSLEHRNNFSFEKGTRLWLTYMASALRHTAGQPRLFVFYEDLMEDWSKEIKRLADFLGRQNVTKDKAVQSSIQEFIELELQHYRTSLVDVIDEYNINFSVKSLYTVLRAYTLRHQFDQSLIDLFSSYAMEAARLQEELEAALEQARREAAEYQGRWQGALAFLDYVLHSKSWRLTAPLRWAYGRLRALRAGVASGLGRIARLLVPKGLRELWYRKAYDALPLQSLTPTVTEAGPNKLNDVIRWIPSVGIENQKKHAFFTHPPARVTYRLRVPPRAMFRAFVALLPEVWGKNLGGVEFEVSISPPGGGQSLTRKRWIHPTRFPHHRRWMEFRVDLHSFAYREADLTLSTAVHAGATADFAWAVWGDPLILSRKSFREVWALSRAYLKMCGLHGTLKGLIKAARQVDKAEVGAARPRQEVAPQDREPVLPSYLVHMLKAFLSNPSTRMVFPRFQEPLVSIVIPTFNHAEYLYLCLQSILAYTDVPFEVIIVDDCSHDATPQLLSKIDNIQIVRNKENQEFIRSCNTGARLVKGCYILFLNDDVIVTPQWLSRLVETLEQYPKCGAVGAKLIRLAGTLQEAGSIVWQDGSALAYGRDDDPSKPEYCYLREVDYCSAACLLVRAELFRKLGGFDELYLPAYYEDADLCFGLRRLGYKIVFQPHVTVFHYEFGSRGFERAKALMEGNQPKFVKKWAQDLSQQYAYGDVLRARDRRQGKRVLVMDDQIPAPYLGSGFPRAYKMLEFLAELGFVVTFIPLTDPTPHQPTTQQLQQLGIEVFYGNHFNVETLFRERAGYYDVVVISRLHNGARWLSLARQWFPTALCVYDAEALFCMRDILKAEVEGRPLSEVEKKALLKQELDVMKEADVIITVSETERDIIVREKGHANVVVWGYVHDVYVSTTPFSKRKDLLFVGGFLGNHPSNADAVLYFTTRLFTRIRERLPNCRFIIVGSNPPESVRRLASESIVVTGFVEDLREYYEKCRVFVAPIRFMAGISLKLIEAMSHGIPAVVSPVVASGLGLQDGREVLIAKNDEEFIAKVIRLYTDETLWFCIQQAAQDYIRQHCSPEVMKQNLKNYFHKIQE